MTSAPRRKLIEVALPLEAINIAAQAERRAKSGHPSTLHLWWSRKPLPACRAVLFAQLVDDPSSWPKLFVGEEAQETERQRLFQVLEDCAVGRRRATVQAEVARSLARGRIADGLADERDRAAMTERTTPASIRAYLRDVAPPAHDPFVGSGTTALAARWIGLRAVVGDINPVAILITRALLQVPSVFSPRPPVLGLAAEPGSKKAKKVPRSNPSMAEDVRRAAEWVREEAGRRIGKHYPRVRIDKPSATSNPTLAPLVGQEVSCLAWLWARTIRSPDPTVGGAHVPLMSTFWLSKTSGREVWLEPVTDSATRTYRIAVRRGSPADPKVIAKGTKAGTGAQFRCVLSGAGIHPDYVRKEAAAGKLGLRMVAAVLDGPDGPIYVEVTPEMERAAAVPAPEWVPKFELVKNSRHMCPWAYGGETYDRLFLPRQLLAMVTVSELVHEVRGVVTAAALKAGFPTDPAGLEEGGRGARAYGDAVAVYLACAVDRFADHWSMLSSWEPSGEGVSHAFTRQALAMNWNVAEVNPFSGRAASFDSLMKWTIQSVPHLDVEPDGRCDELDATTAEAASVPCVICTDPPYGNTVPYGDISDFFYVWLRRALREVYPSLFRTVLVPKEAELIADPFRHGSTQQAERFFTEGMAKALDRLRRSSADGVPIAIFYAFKQAESRAGGRSATGWETFLEGVIGAGLGVMGTWPLRTETSNRMRARNSNALASSIVLVCRPRDAASAATTRGDFRRLLKTELPQALRALQQENIAPVDLAQASIGPGMALFSRFSRIIEADGSSMSVRTALQLINEILDEFLTERESELDPLSRFAVTWFETHGMDAGEFGDAETLAKARNVSVSRVAEVGIAHAAGGHVRLLKRSEMSEANGNLEELPTWVAAQRLIRELETDGEDAAARVCRALGTEGDRARDLAYRLYHTCERRGWAELGRAFNGLVVAWPEIERLALTLTPLEE